MKAALSIEFTLRTASNLKLRSGDNLEFRSCALLFIALLTSAVPALTQEPYFRGKTIRIVVGFSARGGYDVYARAIARHMGKHIPGNPSIIVENMAGAASLISANYVYKAAKPDGLTIGHFIGGLFLQQVLGREGVEFDARKYAKTDEAKKLIQVGAHDPGTLARPFVFPPGTPKDRVQILRKAFAGTMADAEFLAEAKKSNLDISPLSGEDVENIFKIEPTIAAKLKQILLPK